MQMRAKSESRLRYDELVQQNFRFACESFPERYSL